MIASAVPVLDPSWWAGHALASTQALPSATWCWFNARHWLPEIDRSPRGVPTADAHRLLRQAALLLEAAHRGGAARRWLSAADLVWARRTGLAMLGATPVPRLSMRDVLTLFEEDEQVALHLALPRDPAQGLSIPFGAALAPRMRRLLATCRAYSVAGDADASTGRPS